MNDFFLIRLPNLTFMIILEVPTRRAQIKNEDEEDLKQ